MTCHGRHVVHKCIAVIERKRFSHCCAQTQAATLTWLAYYDFTCVYVANTQTSLKSLLAFVHNDAKNTFSQSPQYISVHQHMTTMTRTYRESYMELQVVYAERLVWRGSEGIYLYSMFIGWSDEQCLPVTIQLSVLPLKVVCIPQ